MRTTMLAGAAALAFATMPAALTAQYQTPEAAPVTSEAAEPAPAIPPVSTEPAPRTTAEANARATPLPTTTEVIPGQPGEPDTVVTTHPGNLAPPPATAFNKTYPLCTRTLQDSCRNPGEGEGEDTGLGG